MYKIESKNVDFFYGSTQALKNINISIKPNTVTALIGPSGCGKSTYLRLFNRMNDLIDGTRIEGSICIDGENIYAKGVNVDSLRKKVGMVFQKPNPFPKTIFENVAYGLRVNGVTDKKLIEEREKMAKYLAKSHFVTKVYPSDANFLLVSMNDARRIYEYLVDNGIIVRDRSKIHLCDNSLRITIGTMDEDIVLLQALKDYI